MPQSVSSKSLVRSAKKEAREAERQEEDKPLAKVSRKRLFYLFLLDPSLLFHWFGRSVKHRISPPSHACFCSGWIEVMEVDKNEGALGSVRAKYPRKKYQITSYGPSHHVLGVCLIHPALLSSVTAL